MTDTFEEFVMRFPGYGGTAPMDALLAPGKNRGGTVTMGFYHGQENLLDCREVGRGRC